MRRGGGWNVRIPPHEVEFIAALALPFIHPAGDIVGAADLEHDCFGLSSSFVSTGHASARFAEIVIAIVGELGHDVANASGAFGSSIWRC